VSLANNFGSIEKLRDATEDKLLEINDIGKVVAESIMAYFSDEDNLKQLDELKELGMNPTFEDPNKLPLNGKSYVITGTLSSMKREEAEDKLREKGATITSGVVKNTTALIAGEKPGKSKTDKAEKLGIPTITEAELLKLIA
jgi:DNA ligase (NAD+)